MRAVTLGEDPSVERQSLRDAMTIDELCNLYVADMEAGRINGKKASTIKSDKSRIAAHIRPKLGKLKINSLTGETVETFMNNLSPGSAKRVVATLGAIYSFAVKRKIVSVNPVHGIDKPADVKRNRRLSNAEYVQFGATLKGDVISDIFLMLAITGWRSSEVRLLKHSECDLERCIVTLGDTKSGVSIRPLSGAAIEIIKRQKQNGPHVFEYKHGEPINTLSNQWALLKMPEDVSPHVLRHSFASLGADLGLTDSTIAGLIGHKQQSITSRYIHMDKALIGAANVVAEETLRLMKG